MSVTKIKRNPENLTPMMRQYFSLKEAHPNELLLFRLGDFYELFFDDAVKAAEILNIALTRRGQHQGGDIPMCGIPFHSLDHYLPKLIKASQRVAVCEQLETPEEAKKRGYKAIVKREVTRIITAGTLLEDSLLEPGAMNFLACLSKIGTQYGLAWVDISNGCFFAALTTSKNLSADLSRIAPSEILISDSLLQDKAITSVLAQYKGKLTDHAQSLFHFERAKRQLLYYYQVSTIESFGTFQSPEIVAAGALVEYIMLTQKGHRPRLQPLKRFEQHHRLVIDAATRHHLELFETVQGHRKGSLFSYVNATKTASGSRFLSQCLAAPSAQAHTINARLDAVTYYLAHESLLKELCQHLGQIPDIERALARICIAKASPKDLLILKRGLIHVRYIAELLEGAYQDLPDELRGLLRKVGCHDALLSLLSQALSDEEKSSVSEGNFIASGYHPKLDELRALQQNSQTLILQLKQRYQQESGVPSLKINHNNVLGYYIEMAPQHSKKAPAYFVHRQTLGSVVRYTTEELQRLEQELLNANEHSVQLERTIFVDLVEKISSQSDAIALSAEAIAAIDMLSSFAVLATTYQWVRPTISTDEAFLIEKGRHPIVEVSLREGSGEVFIPNDCCLEQTKRIWLLTGPNMAGKSTFLRQNALMVILAQMGCYVPAEKACIGVVDRLFSRIGASDDLAKGQSTFMVEMVETATILNQATKRSLVILDEVGRGTSTFDGLSIAWACLEHLHEYTQCRTLFATHYQELTQLERTLKGLACYTMAVKEWEDTIVFLHQIQQGVADQSYGIHVAELAGLPKKVISRAKDILKLIQQSETADSLKQLSQALPLFSQELSCASSESAVEMRLKVLDIDQLTPKQALELLYELKASV